MVAGGHVGERQRRGSVLVAYFARNAHGAVVDAAFTRDALKGEAFVGYLCMP